MKIVLDTNVIISGIFFTGPPYKILKAWRGGRVDLVISTDVLDEYKRVGEALSQKFRGVDIVRILDLLTVGSEVVHAPPLPDPICSDPEDDKFLACALAGSAEYVVTGDRHLLRVSRYASVAIVTPRGFLEKHLGG